MQLADLHLLMPPLLPPAAAAAGERKRVSIGHELLINPAILMLDEPTSGLDSTTALHLLVTLKQLALGGRAIATTIHQPSSRLYQQLDRLMLLAEGHVMYYGAADKVRPRVCVWEGRPAGARSWLFTPCMQPQLSAV